MKAIHFGISVVIYLLFWCVFSYLLVFLGGPFLDGYAALPAFMKTVDSGPVLLALPGLPPAIANAALILAFGLQHSLMARSGFKAIVTRLVPASLERSTYVLMSTIAMGALMLFWQPLGGVVWAVENATLATWLNGLYLASWGFLLYATFAINHFDLFGLRQVWYSLRDQERPDLPFVTSAIYGLVRHPIYTGWLGIFWFTPTMTVTHLLFAIGASGYIFVGMWLEERDLRNMHPEYADYQRAVPALFPSLRKRPQLPQATTTA